MTKEERRAKIQFLLKLIEEGKFYSGKIPLNQIFSFHNQPRPAYQSSTDRSSYNYGYETIADLPDSKPKE